MKNSNHNGVCHICGKNGQLTFEHIPPKNAFNSECAITYNGEENIKECNGIKPRYKKIQQGMGKYSLCENRNNITGAWYANAYCDMAKMVAYYIHDNLTLQHGDIKWYKFEKMPALPFVKQIIAMICSLIPFEQVEQLGFNKLLLDKYNNSVDTNLFDLRMYLTPIETGQFYSGISTVGTIKDDTVFEAVTVVDFATYPFGFILNLTPDVKLKYGVSINNFFECSYNDAYEIIMPLQYIERIDNNFPLPLQFKSISNLQK